MIYKLALFTKAQLLDRTIRRLQAMQATEVRQQYYFRRPVLASQAKADFLRAKYDLKIRELQHQKNLILREISFAN